MTAGDSPSHVVALAGGVGGAKLAHGLALAGLDERLSVIVNTADDFTLYGLHISPDLDTVLYTLAGRANPETGWGVAGDSYITLETMRDYGVDTWFLLGDKDLATHILRTERLREGERLTAVMTDFARQLGIRAHLLPMCDEPVQTKVRTAEGLLDFQDYFVRRRHNDDVDGVAFIGIDAASITDEAARAIEEAGVIVFCPSNPFVSIDPILAVGDLRERLKRSLAPVVAVSPIIGGEAVKGPAARMLASLGHEVSAAGVASYYRGLIDVLVIDEVDRELSGRIEALGIRTATANTLMKTDEDRAVLARFTIEAGLQGRPDTRG